MPYIRESIGRTKVGEMQHTLDYAEVSQREPSFQICSAVTASFVVSHVLIAVLSSVA